MSTTPHLIGYARVPKGDEHCDATQAQALKPADCARGFEETASLGRWERPKLQEMIDKPDKGRIVLVCNLDRLSRRLKDLPHLIGKIETVGARFQSLAESIDTHLRGRMMMQLVGSFAEFERPMIREHTTAGHVRARAEGRIGGRRRKQRAEIVESAGSGRKSAGGMARLCGVSQRTVSQIVAEHHASTGAPSPADAGNTVAGGRF